MPDRRRRPLPSPTWRIALAAALLITTLAPQAALAGGSGSGAAHRGSEGGGAQVRAFAPPTETCEPQETRGAGGFSDICSPATGGGGFSLAGLLPILAIVVGGGVVLLIAAFVILRRTSAPLVPADPGEWWTCRNCGKTNVVGSARCYACGAWQR